MVIAGHIIIGCYGFWLPNEQRGSWSDFVRSYELYQFGGATKVDTRRSVADQPHDRNRRQTMRTALKYPPVRFTGEQAACVARGFRKQTETSGYTLWACAIMPTHTHLVVARHRYKLEQVANLIKGAATRQLNAENLHPLADHRNWKDRPPSPWCQKPWVVFLDTDDDVVRSIDYVENNPLKHGLRRQCWSFVSRFDDGSTPLRGVAKR